MLTPEKRNDQVPFAKEPYTIDLGIPHNDPDKF